MSWLWLLVVVAWSGPPATEDGGGAEQIASPVVEPSAPTVPDEGVMMGPLLDLPPTSEVYSDVVVAGAKQLSMSEAFVDDARRGLDLLYGRKYKETRAHFAKMDKAFPGTAVAAIADVLVWQAIMLENFDFRHDAQYEAASSLARAQLDAASNVPGNEAWEQFMMAGVNGIEAIHAARKSKYLPALRLAFEAIDHVERVRKVAPDFVDLKLADGLYNYWRTVITQRSKVLPDFGDRRQEGIAQVAEVEDHGIFLGPPATLAMTFTWIEERDFDKALASSGRNRIAYPDNVVNELMLGVIYLYKKDPGKAITTFDHVLELAPDSKRVRYYRGLAHQRAKNYDRAEQDFSAYLAFDYMEDYQRAAAHYRLGQVYEHTDRYADAEAAYKEALKVDSYDPAKAALDGLKKRRREGKISW